jgi:hypothetical protein
MGHLSFNAQMILPNWVGGNRIRKSLYSPCQVNFVWIGQGSMMARHGRYSHRCPLTIGRPMRRSKGKRNGRLVDSSDQHGIQEKKILPGGLRYCLLSNIIWESSFSIITCISWDFIHRRTRLLLRKLCRGDPVNQQWYCVSIRGKFVISGTQMGQLSVDLFIVDSVRAYSKSAFRYLFFFRREHKFGIPNVGI